MKNILIRDGIITLSCDGEYYNLDTPFQIDAQTILVIGIENKLIFDDDIDIVYFIDNKFEIFTVTIQYISGVEELYSLILKLFKINLGQEFMNNKYDDNIIVYPQNLYKKTLFVKKNILSRRKLNPLVELLSPGKH